MTPIIGALAIVASVAAAAAGNIRSGAESVELRRANERDASTVLVDPSSQHFITPDGRVLIMHGVNAVYKVPPYVPPTSFCDPLTSMCAKDIQWLKDNGFNGVRLGLLWRGLMPTRGVVNNSYLEQITALVSMLEDAGIYTMLDAHQDDLSEHYCGEGFPDFALLTNVTPAEKFPFPVDANITFNPQTGLPTEASCVQYNFDDWMLSLEVNQAWGSIYDRAAGVQNYFAQHWSTVAKAFAGASEYVLGYELLNEPFAGNALADLFLVLDPALSEAINLMPLYEVLNDAIRAEDPSRIVFYERMILAPYVNATPGFTTGPGGVASNDKQALSEHLYCFGVNASGAIINVTNCEDIYTNVWARFLDDAKIVGGGRALTEFGAVGDDTNSEATLAWVMDRSDEAAISTFYWQFKPFNDPTTNNATVEGLFFPNGTVQDNKYTALVRPYPQKTPAEPASLKYGLDHSSGTFTLSYTLSSTATNKTTVVFAPTAVYPGGPTVVLSPPSSGTVRSDGQYIMIDHADTASGAITVSLSKASH